MSAAASDPAISVVGLAKRYGTTRAVDGLSFEVARGEVFGLLGPNGAGKTTTVETLEGYRSPDRGHRTRAGSRSGARRDRAAAPDRRDAPRGRALPRPEAARAAPPVRGVLRRRRVARSPPRPRGPARRGPDRGASALRRPDSSGSHSRARSIGKPEVIFLDEPTAGMDPHARATTWQLVRDLRDRGVTILLTTHAMDEAEHLCDRVAIVTGGKLAALGSPAELTRHAAAEEIWFAADARARRRRDRHARSIWTRPVSSRTAPASTSCGQPGHPRASRISPASCATRTSLSRRCRRVGGRSKRSSCRSPRKRLGNREAPRTPRPGSSRDGVAAAPGREPDRDSRDPARHPRVLRQGRRASPPTSPIPSTSSCPGCCRWR